MRRTGVFAWALLGCGLSVFGCSSSSSREVATSQERIGRQRQALGAEYVCRMSHGTDMGYPVFDLLRSRTLFFFGDNWDASGATDPLGSTTSGTATCAITRQDNPPVTLTGYDVGGNRTPIGAVYVPDGDRIVAGFTATPHADPDMGDLFSLGMLGEAPAANPMAFSPILDSAGTPIPNNSTHFFVMAPVVMDVSLLADDPNQRPPGASSSALVVFGTGKPFRASAIYAAAVRLDQLHDPTMWRFFDANRTWNTSVGYAAPLFPELPPDGNPPGATGCAGEISIGYNQPFRKWMLVYKCFRHWVSGRGPAQDGVVLMRTAANPFERWSAPTALFVPAKEGVPQEGDPGYGTFMHRANLRMYRTAVGQPLQRLPNYPFPIAPVDAIGRNEPSCVNDANNPCQCASSFPAACPPAEQNALDPQVGCCVESNKCCDRIFDHYPPESGGSGSGTDGAAYAPYVVQNWATPLDGSASTPSTHQMLYYLMSTWNPYQVVLMKNELFDNDVDNDGVDAAADNCPTTYNPGQQNCNKDAEDAWNASHDADHQVEPLGDACDPVPCPTADADRQVEFRNFIGSCSGNAWMPTSCFGREIRKRIDVSPVGASPTPARVIASATGLPKNITVAGVETYTRFCQQGDTTQGFDCFLASIMHDDEINHDDPIDPLHPWHRVQLHRSCASNELPCIDGNDLDPVPREGSFTMDYGPGKRRYIWEYEADNQLWTTPGAKMIPDNPDPTCTQTNFFGSGTCLNGRMWTHGVTDVGKNGYFGNDEVGGIQVGWHGEELANHYFAAAPDVPFAGTRGGMLARPIFFLRFTLPDPWPVWRFATDTVIPIVNEDGQWTAVFESGRREGLSGPMTTAAQQELAVTAFKWLSAEEASPFAGSPTRPLGVAVRSYVSGLEIRQTLVDNAGVVDAGGPAQTLSGGDGAPSARVDYAAVYSRARGRVFVAGGHDASTGAPLRDLWSFELDRGYWKRVPRIDGELFDVVAMTYSYRDGSVWLVDRDARDPQAVTTRLLRVDPTTGSWEIVHSTQPANAHAYDTQMLGVTVDGDVILTASNTSPQRHRVAVISSRAAGYDVRLSTCRKRSLVTPALADLRGYALFFAQDVAIDETCVEDVQPPLGVPSERLDELPLRSATLGDLEAILY